MDPFELIVFLLVLSLLALGFVLPIAALILAITTRRRLNKEIARLRSSLPANAPQQIFTVSPDTTAAAGAIQQLEERIDQLEATLRAMREGPRPPVVPAEQPPPLPPSPVPSPQVEVPPPPLVEPVSAPTPTKAKAKAADLESIIGRRLVGWIAIGLILLATAFFLKFAFDNRWIGELGRVAIGVAAGVGLNILGYRYYRRGWRIFSQLLIAGGIVLLYLSAYAAFGYYHLVTQKAAFVYLIILVAQAAALAVLYNAQAIAVMALIGGFLAPVLLRSDRDQYRSLFGYLALLDVGALAMPKHWLGLGSLAFGGTHFLFWLWYGENYHPRKLAAVITFHTGIFLIFLLSAVGRRLFRREAATIEDLMLLPANAFVFFATAYFFLSPEYHDWMGLFAIGMAIIYAGTSKLLLDRKATTEREMLAMIGVALTFVTVAIPIQLKANWITIAWSVQALTTLWVAIRIRSTRLLITSYTLIILAVGKLFVWDTYFNRAIFTPVLNKYFLSSLVVTTCVFLAASLHRGWKAESRIVPRFVDVVVLMLAIITLWWVLSVETITYFFAHASALKEYEEYRHQLWLGQMALSVLWTLYAAVLAAIGFVRRSAPIRWAALALFGVTVVKVMFIDIAQLRQLYRIVAFLVLGVVLLVVAWGYHKAFRRKESLS
ncbi:MAG TPA: DUF2339 domain-containing protein [Pyrinomonadaceae bacterium]|nr:DUF2339 domain-containing protein [Pyrinomonadaceae bacterium]